MIAAGKSLLQACTSANIPSVNNRYTLAAVVVAAAVVIVCGIFLVYRSLTFFLPLRKLSTPSELRTPKVILGQGLFSKSLYYQDPSLGVITDIEKGADGQLVLVGQSGAVVLNPNLQPASIAHYPKCMSDVAFVNLSTGTFLCRGSWVSDIALFNRDGQLVWRYGAKTPGIDDAVAGQIEGSETVIVGLNGDGGLHRLDPQGKELWQQPDGNVWHVEIAVPDSGTGAMILHSNARGQLISRDGAGNVVRQDKPEIYVSHFALTAWDDHPTRNDLITPGDGSLYILTMHAQTLAKLSAPGTAGVDEVEGTSVRLSALAMSYAALVRHSMWKRSVLYIYDKQQRLIYQEVLDHDCGALFARANSSGNEDLLLGCDGSVWKYSQN
jgi:hypothetical protein